MILYTSDGEARQEFSVVFTARPIGGTPTTSSESREVEWVAPDGGRRAADGPLDAAADRALPVRAAARPTWADGARCCPLTGCPSSSTPLSAVGTIGAFAVGFVLFRREHRREEARAEDERRSQAVKVSAWVEAQRTAHGGREVLFFVHNASDMPIYEVSLPTPDDGRRRGRVHRPGPARPDHPAAGATRVAGHLLRTRAGRDRVPGQQRPAVDPQRAGLHRPHDERRRRRPLRRRFRLAPRIALISAACARSLGAAREIDSVHDVVGRVAVQDLRDPLVHVDAAARPGRSSCRSRSTPPPRTGRRRRSGTPRPASPSSPRSSASTSAHVWWATNVHSDRSPNPVSRRWRAPSSGWKPRHDQRRGVPDVVQPRRRLDHVRPSPSTATERARLPRDALGVRPPPRQLRRQQRPAQLARVARRPPTERRSDTTIRYPRRPEPSPRRHDHPVAATPTTTTRGTSWDV